MESRRSGIKLWTDVPDEKWNDWHWQVANRIDTVEEFAEVIDMDEQEKQDIAKVMGGFRVGVTPYYAALMDPKDRDDPIRMQAVPRIAELTQCPEDMTDPLHEDEDSPALGLTHRYPDRVLFLITDQCAMYCRHCTRRRMAGETDAARSKEEIDACIEYIKRTPQVRDVLLSGGDPLLVSDERLEYILSELRKIPHVEIIRIGTRAPVVLPMRITDGLINVLKKYQPIWVNVQFNHASELTEQAIAACDRLTDNGIPLNNQSVLLRGVNDCVHIMRGLVQALVKNRIRPYYIYQCDLSVGIEHFRTPVAKGIEIIEGLRGHTTGFAVPTFVVDAPGGGGKIPVMPQYVISQTPDRVILRNYEGVITTYTEPKSYYSDEIRLGRATDGSHSPTAAEEGYEGEDSDALCRPACESREPKHDYEGVVALAEGEMLALEPQVLKRHERNKK